MGSNRARLSVFVAVLISVVSLVAIVPASALHWSGSGSFGPTSVYQGVTTTFTFTLNNQASGSLDVNWVWVHYCWEVSNYGYYFKANDGTTVSIPGGASHGFTGSVPVDQSTLGSCALSIQVNGKAVGDLAAETATYSGSITVLAIPPLQVAAAANPNNGQANLAVSFTATVTGGLAPYTYAWTFGDGGTDSVSNPTHTYTQAGTYTVTVVVTDSQNNQKSATTTVTVTSAFFGGGVGSSGGLLVVIGVAVAIIAVIAAVAIVVMRRRKPGPPAQPPMQQPPTPPT